MIKVCMSEMSDELKRRERADVAKMRRAAMGQSTDTDEEVTGEPAER